MGNRENEKSNEGGTIETTSADVPPSSETGAKQAKARRWTKQHWVGLLLIVGIIVVFLVVYLLSKALGNAWLYGYFGVFLLSLMASATLIIYIPAFPVVFVMGAILNPWLVGLMVGLSEPIGELTGYMAGYSGKVALQNRKFYTRLERRMQQRLPLVIFGLSAIPNPFTDIAGVAAGATRYPVWKFLLVMFAGKMFKGLLVAFAGYWTLRLLVQHLIG